MSPELYRKAHDVAAAILADKFDRSMAADALAVAEYAEREARNAPGDRDPGGESGGKVSDREALHILMRHAEESVGFEGYLAELPPVPWRAVSRAFLLAILNRF